MTALTLYQLSEQLRSLEDLADSEDLPDEFIRDTLEALEGTFEDKATAVGKFVLSLQANSRAVIEAGKAMTERGKRVERAADRLKAYLLLHMQATQRRKIDRPDITLRVQANPPAVIITDETLIPPQYFVPQPPPPPKLDKKLLLEGLKSGLEIPGAYMQQGEHIRISV